MGFWYRKYLESVSLCVRQMDHYLLMVKRSQAKLQCAAVDREGEQISVGKHYNVISSRISFTDTLLYLHHYNNPQVFM